LHYIHGLGPVLYSAICNTWTSFLQGLAGPAVWSNYLPSNIAAASAPAEATRKPSTPAASRVPRSRKTPPTIQQHSTPEQNTTSRGNGKAALSCPLETLQQLYAKHTTVLPQYTTESVDVTAKDLTDAVMFRDNMEARTPNPQQVCCVCARCLPVLRKQGHSDNTPPHTVHTCSIPNSELLRTDRAACSKFPKDKYPRHGLTTCNMDGTEYCLEEAGVHGEKCSCIVMWHGEKCSGMAMVFCRLVLHQCHQHEG